MTDLTQTTTDSGTTAATGDAPDKGQTPAKVTFTKEQQAVMDVAIAERLKRAEEKWRGDTDAAKAAETDAAEKKRLEDEKNFEELASKHERAAADYKTKYEEVKANWERAEAIFTELVESKKKGLLEPMAKLIEGMDVFDQFRTINAYLEAQPATTEAKPPATPRKSTTPTPPAQTGETDHVQEAIKRQKDRATASDPYSGMFKR